MSMGRLIAAFFALTLSATLAASWSAPADAATKHKPKTHKATTTTQTLPPTAQAPRSYQDTPAGGGGGY